MYTRNICFYIGLKSELLPQCRRNKARVPSNLDVSTNAIRFIERSKTWKKDTLTNRSFDNILGKTKHIELTLKLMPDLKSQRKKDK